MSLRNQRGRDVGRLSDLEGSLLPVERAAKVTRWHWQVVNRTGLSIWALLCSVAASVFLFRIEVFTVVFPYYLACDVPYERQNPDE